MNEFNDRKVIRNRNIVREIDRNSTVELRWYICVGFVFAGLVCVYNWQQHRMVEFGYRMEALKKETALLQEASKKLYLEQASLESPARIYQLAQDKLGLGPPKSHQIIFETVSSTDSTLEPAALVWDLSRKSKTLSPITETNRTQ